MRGSRVELFGRWGGTHVHVPSIVARRIGECVRTAAPALLDLDGCGELTAAKIVAEVAGVERFKSEAAFARYVRAAPIQHWSGDTNVRLRPARHGNRQLNMAVHRIAVTQIRMDSPGKDYFQRRLAEADTRSRALRSLRLARVVFTRLKRSTETDDAPGPSDPTIWSGRHSAVCARSNAAVGRRGRSMSSGQWRRINRGNPAGGRRPEPPAWRIPLYLAGL